jgi:LuxR family maltose regulon positive regulatory protein
VHYERNELDAARELLDRHLGLAAELGFVDQLVAGYVTQSRLDRLRGDVREAGRTLGRGMELAHSRGFRRLELNIVAEHMTHSLATGQLDRIARLAAVHELHLPEDAVVPKPGTTTRTEARAVAWTLLARSEGRTDEALRVARRWQRFTEGAGAVRSEIRWCTIVAQVLLAAGDPLGADRAIRRALCIAAPGRFVRTFLDVGRALPGLLEHRLAAGTGTADAAEAFGRELLTLATGRDVFGPSGGADAAIPSEPLSAREIEIVELVASGMSNRDIAGRLGMTEGTVKWHLHRIFDKVGARRRTQAVHCARRIGLIA